MQLSLQQLLRRADVDGFNPHRVPTLIAKIRNDVDQPVPPSASPADQSSSNSNASEAGKTASSTFVPETNIPPDSVKRTPSGAVIETIASVEPDGSPVQTPEEVEEETLNSMHRHGEGNVLPPSVQNPEDRLDRKQDD